MAWTYSLKRLKELERAVLDIGAAMDSNLSKTKRSAADMAEYDALGVQYSTVVAERDRCAMACWRRKQRRGH